MCGLSLIQYLLHFLGLPGLLPTHAGVRRPRLKPSFSLISRSQHQTPTGFLSSDEMAPRTQWACHRLKDNTAPPDCTVFLQTRLFQLPTLTITAHSPHHPGLQPPSPAHSPNPVSSHQVSRALPPPGPHCHPLQFYWQPPHQAPAVILCLDHCRRLLTCLPAPRPSVSNPACTGMQLNQSRESFPSMHSPAQKQLRLSSCL